MVDFILLLAAALHQAAPAEPPPPSATASEAQDQAAPNEEIEVRARRICRPTIINSAESRLERTKVCLTRRQWNELRDEAVQFYDDIPRRNPRKGPSSTAQFAPK